MKVILTPAGTDIKEKLFFDEVEVIDLYNSKFGKLASKIAERKMSKYVYFFRGGEAKANKKFVTEHFPKRLKDIYVFFDGEALVIPISFFKNVNIIKE